MISIQDMQINIVRAYVKHIEKLYPTPEDGADRLILVLKIYEWQLLRYKKCRSANVDELGTLKHGIRQAELLLEDIQENEPELMQGWYLGCKEQNQAHRLANLLWQIIMSLTQEVVETERQYPKMKSTFDHEREQYRVMLAEAREAEAR